MCYGSLFSTYQTLGSLIDDVFYVSGTGGVTSISLSFFWRIVTVALTSGENVSDASNGTEVYHMHIRQLQVALPLDHCLWIQCAHLSSRHQCGSDPVGVRHAFELLVDSLPEALLLLSRAI